MSVPSNRLMPAFAVLFCVVLFCVPWFPGHVSTDVLQQLEQGRTLDLSDVWPPAAALLLGASDRLVGSTGLLLFLNVLAVFAGTALVARRASFSMATALLTLLTAIPLLVLLPQVWSDLHLLAVLAIAAVLIPDDGRGARARWLLCAALLAWAPWIRHNAVLAALPFAWWLSRSPGAPWSQGQRAGSRVLLAGLVLLLVVSRWISGTLIDSHVSVWAVAPMWDMQAISVDIGQRVVPAELLGPDVEIDALRTSFSPNTAVPLFSSTPGGVRNPVLERFSTETSDVLLQAWASSIVRYPGPWLSHRMHVVAGLIGPHLEGDLVYMVDASGFEPGTVQPKWQANLHTRAVDTVEAIKSRGWVRAAPALLIAALMLLLRMRSAAAAGLKVSDASFALLFSAVLYGGSLFVIAPSAELRYLAWPLWALWAAVMLAPGRQGSSATNASGRNLIERGRPNGRRLAVAPSAT